MLKGFCRKKRKIVANGKVANYCWKVNCQHLKLQVKKKHKTKRRAKWKNVYSVVQRPLHSQ